MGVVYLNYHYTKYNFHFHILIVILKQKTGSKVSSSLTNMHNYHLIP